MATKEKVLEMQELRLQVLKKIYDKVFPYMDNFISSDNEIKEIFPDNQSKKISGILLFLIQKKYIRFTDNSDDFGFSCFDIQITAKGIELIEKLKTGGNVSKFEEDFSRSVLNVSFGNVTNSSIIAGNGNSQTVSITENDTDSIIKFIDKLIEKNPDKAELVKAKEAVIEQKMIGKIPEQFLKFIGATLKQYVTDVSATVLTTGAFHMLGL